MAAWMLNGLGIGESRGTKPCVFSDKVAPEGTSCVRRVRAGSFWCFFVPVLLLWLQACLSLCVRSYRVIWNLGLQIEAGWLHDLPCCVAMCVERCRFATWCCKTHFNGCMNVECLYVVLYIYDYICKRINK